MKRRPESILNVLANLPPYAATKEPEYIPKKPKKEESIYTFQMLGHKHVHKNYDKFINCLSCGEGFYIRTFAKGEFICPYCKEIRKVVN